MGHGFHSLRGEEHVQRGILDQIDEETKEQGIEIGKKEGDGDGKEEGKDGIALEEKVKDAVRKEEKKGNASQKHGEQRKEKQEKEIEDTVTIGSYTIDD